MSKVIVYGKVNCKQCDYTKKHLDKSLLKDKYSYIDVTDDQEKIDYIKNEHGFSSLPVIVYNDTKFSGFNPTKLNNIIKEFTNA